MQEKALDQAYGHIANILAFSTKHRDHLWPLIKILWGGTGDTVPFT